MGAEVGATTSTFPYTPYMRAYLNATGRGPVATAADVAAAQGFLSADEGAEYDEVIEIVSFAPPHFIHRYEHFNDETTIRICQSWSLPSTDLSPRT